MAGGKIASGVFEQGGARYAGWVNNIGLAAATTDLSNDSIEITASDGSALSPLNQGWVTLPSTTPGRLVTLSITENVKIQVRDHRLFVGLIASSPDSLPATVYAINDSGSLKWGVTYKSRRLVISDSDDVISPNDDARKVLVNSALTGDSPCVPIGWFNADLDDIDAGYIEAVNTSIGDINIGLPPPSKEYFLITAGNGHGAVNNKIRLFSNQPEQFGTSVTLDSNSDDGHSFTIIEDGLYEFIYSDGTSGTVAARYGFSLNSTQLTTDIATITAADRLGIIIDANATASTMTIMLIRYLVAGDVIRPHTDGDPDISTDAHFIIRKVDNNSWVNQ